MYVVRSSYVPLNSNKTPPRTLNGGRGGGQAPASGALVYDNSTIKPYSNRGCDICLVRYVFVSHTTSLKLLLFHRLQ